MIEKEKRNIYNVSFNDKNSTPINAKLEAIENTDKIKEEGLPKTPLSPSDDMIITFYSDRNINTRMEFKNPKVKEHYEKQEQIKTIQEAVKRASQNINSNKNMDIEL